MKYTETISLKITKTQSNTLGKLRKRNRELYITLH